MPEEQVEAGEVEEAEEVLDVVFPSSNESAEVVQPGDRPFRHPALAPQALRGLDPFAGQAGQHMPSPHGGAMGRRHAINFIRSDRAG